MKSDLKPGLTHRQTLIIDASLTVPAVSKAFAGFAGMPPVFATAFMVGFVECACIEAIKPFLDDNEGSVGIHVDLSHIAATPIGLTVSADVTLVEVKKKKLKFRVSCRDDFDLIGEGFHERAIIDRPQFNAWASAKAGRLADV